jgi:hypothetical protein
MSEEFKRGDRVLVWDNIEDTKVERIFLRRIDGALRGIVCVNKKDEDFFNDGGIGFDIVCYKNCEAIQPMKTKAIEYVQMFMDIKPPKMSDYSKIYQPTAKLCALAMVNELLNYSKKHGYVALTEELEQTKIDIGNL